MVAESAFLDKRVVVEMNVVAGGSWEGMGSAGGIAAKGSHLAVLKSLARAMGKEIGGSGRPIPLYWK